MRTSELKATYRMGNNKLIWTTPHVLNTCTRLVSACVNKTLFSKDTASGKKAKEMAFQQLSYSKREHVCQCFCSGSGVSLCVGQLP